MPIARSFALVGLVSLAARTDALLLSWRLNAPGFRSAWKLSKLRLMGWEHTGSELRGHFLGHWLSAAAMVVAVTGDAELRSFRKRMIERAAALSEQLRQAGSGDPSATHSADG